MASLLDYFRQGQGQSYPTAQYAQPQFPAAQSQPQQQAMNPLYAMLQSYFAQGMQQRPPTAMPQMLGQTGGSDPFYSAVMATLGNKPQAQAGDYARGWNLESSPGTRAQSAQDAMAMQQALGRRLTPDEIARLNQRNQGWGFQQNTWTPSQAGWDQLGADIAKLSGR